MQFLPTQTPSLLHQQYTLPLHISVVNAPPILIAVLLQWQVGPTPTPSAMFDYAPIISEFLPHQFETPLQPSNVPDPLPQL